MNSMYAAGTIPVTRFENGEASEIFDEVRNSGVKIVMKNNAPVCVLLPPEQYDFLIEMASDYMLCLEAESRDCEHNNESLSREEVMHNLGVASEELDDIQVEIENENSSDLCEARRKSVERALAIVSSAAEEPDEIFKEALEPYISGKLTLEELEDRIDRLEYL